MCCGRYESTAEPHRLFVALLPAVVLLLAYKASDSRQTSRTRQKCAELLEAVGPRMAIVAGLTADWGSETRRLVGTFDKQLHDPAKTWSEIEDFRQRSRIWAERQSVSGFFFLMSRLIRYGVPKLRFSENQDCFSGRRTSWAMPRVVPRQWCKSRQRMS